MQHCALWLVFSLSFFWAWPAFAQERILNYAVDASLDAEGVLTVQETITVQIEHQEIRHGLTRSFPLKSCVAPERLQHCDFEFLGAQLDGQEIAADSSHYAHMLGLAVGEPEQLAPLGVHTYTLRFRSRGHVRHLQDRDQLYYNALGTENHFTVEKASFQLTLPEGAEVQLMTAYTGAKGEVGQDFDFTGPMALTSTRPLQPKEGLTVLIDFSQGYVTAETGLLAVKNWLAARRDLSIALLVAFLCLYFLALELRFRKLTKTVAYPEFTPPAAVTPGLCACLHKRGFTELALQADVLWGTVCGLVSLSSQQGELILSKKQSAIGKDLQNKFSTKIVKLIFGKAQRLVLSTDGGDGPNLLEKLEKHYSVLLGSLLRQDNAGLCLLFLGLALSFGLSAALWECIWFPSFTENTGFIECVSAFVMTFFMVFYLRYLGSRIIVQRRLRALHPFSSWLQLLVFGVQACFCLLLLGVLFFLGDPILQGITLGLALTAFFFLAKRRMVFSQEGLELERHLQGLSLYIRIAEKERLERINAPQMSVEHYEAILPYALALGQAEAWQRHFARFLQDNDYQPDWLKRGVECEDIGSGKDQTSTLSNLSKVSLASYAAYSAAQAAASSDHADSDSSSSGSSGGGSGGGGVGGW